MLARSPRPRHPWVQHQGEDHERFHPQPPHARGAGGLVGRGVFHGWSCGAERLRHDRQSRPAGKRPERASELADDERRLRLDALFEAHADQPRQREGPADGMGARAGRHAGRRAEWPGERGEPARSTTGSCTPPTAGARSTRSTRAAQQGRVRRGSTDPGVQHKGNVSRTRGIALVGRARDRQSARRPRDRGEPRHRRDRLGQEDRGAERIRQQGAVLHGADHRRRQGDHRQRRGRRRRRAAGSRRSTRGPATSCGAGMWCRSPASRAARRGRTRTTPGRPAAAASGRPAPTIPRRRLTIWGTGNPVPIYDPQARPGDNLYTNSAVAINIDTGKMAWHFQYTPNDSWDYDEVGMHMLYDTTIDGQNRKVVGAFRPQRLLLHARPHDRKIHQGRPVRERRELDQGDRSQDRQAGRVRPEARRADLQPRGARAARRSA